MISKVVIATVTGGLGCLGNLSGVALAEHHLGTTRVEALKTLVPAELCHIMKRPQECPVGDPAVTRPSAGMLVPVSSRINSAAMVANMSSSFSNLGRRHGVSCFFHQEERKTEKSPKVFLNCFGSWSLTGIKWPNPTYA